MTWKHNASKGASLFTNTFQFGEKLYTEKKSPRICVTKCFKTVIFLCTITVHQIDYLLVILRIETHQNTMFSWVGCWIQSFFNSIFGYMDGFRDWLHVTTRRSDHKWVHCKWLYEVLYCYIASTRQPSRSLPEEPSPRTL